jgi:hypothetical protein
MPNIPTFNPAPMNQKDYSWNGVINLPSKKYTCAYCGGTPVVTYGCQGRRDELYKESPTVSKMSLRVYYRHIYICHECHHPTYFNDRGEQFPKAPPGQRIKHLEEDVNNLYEEARRCFLVAAYTAAAMVLRKILMNVAVAEGADEDKDYNTYVNYLNSKNLVPTKCKFLIDKIRVDGNDANHKIRSVTEEEATVLLTLVELLLKTTYELPTEHMS